jgi:hypothetical protein
VKKRISSTIVVVVMVLLTGPAAVSGDRLDAITVPVGTLVLHPPSGIVAVRSPVAFPHSLHFTYACNQCHHKWNGLTPVKTCMAAGCHDALDPPQKSEKALAYDIEAMPYFKYAYHKRCIGCHKEIRAINHAREKSIMGPGGKVLNLGPVGCVGCHERE